VLQDSKFDVFIIGNCGIARATNRITHILLP